MAPTPKSIRALAAICLISLAIPFAAFQAVADHDGTKHDTDTTQPRECFEKGASSAAIGGVTANGVTLQTQVGGATLELPRDVLQLAVSTTGTLDVTVDHKCVKYYELHAERTDADGTVTPFTFTASPGCISGSDTHSIPIGMNLSEVRLKLVWWGCDGSMGTDYREIRVCDPPLPIGRLN